jgi:hypothetical protein
MWQDKQELKDMILLTGECVSHWRTRGGGEGFSPRPARGGGVGGGGGGGAGGFNPPPPNSEVLKKPGQIPSSVEYNL